MDFIAIFVVCTVLMFILVKVFEKNPRKTMFQLVSIVVVLAVTLIAYYESFNKSNVALYLASIITPFILNLLYIMYKSRLFKRINKMNRTILNEVMISSKILRIRYILSIILLLLALGALIAFTVIKFDIILLITCILGGVFITFYIYQVFKMGITKRDEPIRKLVLIVETNSIKTYTITAKKDYFNTTAYLDKMLEKYYIRPFCKTFLATEKNYEIHNAYYLKCDKFEEFDFLTLENYDFYNKLVKQNDYGLPYYQVSSINGITNFQKIK